MLLFQSPQMVERGYTLLLEMGIAGVMLAINLYIFWRIIKYFLKKEETLILAHKTAMAEKEATVEKYREGEKAMLNQIVEMNQSYAKTLLTHEEKNIESINNITNALHNLGLNFRDLKEMIFQQNLKNGKP